MDRRNCRWWSRRSDRESILQDNVCLCTLVGKNAFAHLSAKDRRGYVRPDDRLRSLDWENRRTNRNRISGAHGWRSLRQNPRASSSAKDDLRKTERATEFAPADVNKTGHPIPIRLPKNCGIRADHNRWPIPEHSSE